MDMSALFQSLPPGMPMPSAFPSPNEVRQKARYFAKELFAAWHTLSAIVERHEEILRKRWMKKTKEQKKKILLTAWPNMSVSHRPDVQAWKRGQKSQQREAYLWPYINLEDLMKPKVLPILLGSRGRHYPHEFAHSDVQQARFGESSAATMPAFLNEYTMLFLGRTTPETYGQLVSWDDDDDAFEKMTNGIGMHPGHGLQALEIQQRVWTFLVSCCKQILHDMESPTSGDIQPEPAFLSMQEEGFISLDVVALEAPYRVPAHLDLARLESLVVAQRDSKEDHLWSLREDPGYFAEELVQYKEHRQEVLEDTNGLRHPTMTSDGPGPLFWNRVLGNVVVQAYFGFASFDQICRQVSTLNQLAEKYKDEIDPEKDLPTEYMKAFQGLRFLLDATSKDIIQNIKVGLPASPPMRPFWSRMPQDPTNTKIQVDYQPPSRDHATRRIIALLEILWTPAQLRLFELHPLIDEIGHMIYTDPEVKALITPWIASRISELSTIAECLHQLHLYQPWARKIEDDMEVHNDELLKEYNATFRGWAGILTTKFEQSALHKLADPSGGKFNYPVNRRRNKANVEAMREAEANLDAFWKAVDTYCKTKASGKSQHDLVAKLLAEDRAIQRTPPWTEPVRDQKAQQPDPNYQPLSQVFYDRTGQVTESYNCSWASTRVKTKTRGAATVQEAIPDVPLRESKDKQATFIVDKRAHKVFKALFHSPSSNDIPAEIPWPDFLHAMAATGFTMEKLHGSAWNFTPRCLDVERSIQFHEPHPSNRIRFVEARRFGRRLGRAYGWKGEMFKLL